MIPVTPGDVAVVVVDAPPAPGLPFPLPFALGFFAPAGACAEGFCTTTGPDGNTGDVDDVEPVDGGCDEVVVGGAGAAQDSVIDTIGSFTGNEIDDNGVPAGTSNDNT